MSKTEEVLNALTQIIKKLGVKDDDGYSFNELTTIGNDEDEMVSFIFIGANFLLGKTGIFSIDEKDTGEIESVALTDELEDAVLSYLKFRFGFAKEFSL